MWAELLLIAVTAWLAIEFLKWNSLDPRDPAPSAHQNLPSKHDALQGGSKSGKKWIDCPYCHEETGKDGVQCLYFYTDSDLTIRGNLWIRLLQIEPAGSGDLRLKMITRYMKSQEGKFYALSYCCGDPKSKRHSVDIEGIASDDIASKEGPNEVKYHKTRAVIWQNLYEALLALRSRNILLVWVDALCLNQANECLQSRDSEKALMKKEDPQITYFRQLSQAEKNLMLPEMRRVYRTAKCTYAWLGPLDYGSERLLYSLKVQSRHLNQTMSLSPGANPKALPAGRLPEVRQMFSEELFEMNVELEHVDLALDDSDEDDFDGDASEYAVSNGEHYQLRVMLASMAEAYIERDGSDINYSQLDVLATENWTIVKPRIQEEFHQLFELFGREFWTRKWIIQELASSPNVKFYCGNSADNDLTWDQLNFPSKMLLENLDIGRISKTKDQRYVGKQNFEFLYRVRNLVRRGLPIHLFWLLRKSTGFNCGRIEDLILPLRTLAFDADLHIPVPSYRDKKEGAQAIRDMLVEASEYRIKDSKNLDSICLVTNEEHPVVRRENYSLALPSWAPDVTAPCLQGETFLRYFCGRDRRPGLDRKSHKWRASGDSEWLGSKFPVESHRKVLKTRGIFLGRIGGAFYHPNVVSERGLKTALVEDGFQTRYPNRYRDLLQTYSLAGAIFGTLTMHKQPEETFDTGYDLRFLFDDSFRSSETARRSKEREDQPNNRYEALWTWIDGCVSLKLDGKQALHFLSGLWAKSLGGDESQTAATQPRKISRLKNKLLRSPSEENVELQQALARSRTKQKREEWQKRIVKALTDAFKDRMSFITITPALYRDIKKEAAAAAVVGWAHSMANLGDDLFLLEGCTVPVVLRRLQSDDRTSGPTLYQVVGDAWIHGVMDGDFWLSWIRNGKQVHIV